MRIQTAKAAHCRAKEQVRKSEMVERGSLQASASMPILPKSVEKNFESRNPKLD
jgi:hypothetical protein